jgi:hypothetical protein
MRHFETASAALLVVLCAALAASCKPRAAEGELAAGSTVQGDEPGGPADEVAAFWSGTLVFAETQRVPTYLVRWNLENRTKVQSQETGGASYMPFWKTIYVASINYNRSVRAGRGEEVLSPQLQPLGLIYNEAFHAWFGQYATSAAACRPLIAEMNAQTQYRVEAQLWELKIPGVLEMAEEALSELVAGLVDKWSEQLRASGELKVPTYESVRREFQLSLTPEHTLDGERWASPDKVKRAAEKPMSERLFKMGLALLESGCDGLAAAP